LTRCRFENILGAFSAARAQSASYAGPITISGYERLSSIRAQLKGIELPLPTGN